ncbi:histone acetyltransferase type B catalytic subunit-like [Ruditapes philippinarum]|uniref:histone acetyltransferase type B catalytic subunit-like n=1 Tax=Ruditapes philippinarum TaxID=129788 RepID=UPI00295B078C|nr:histone acetyltransferase type B catalytic subunit-like [Ruditapes philippinarum]
MAGCGMTLVHNRLDDYKCDANEVITFKLVRDESDLENNEGFQPEMTHQIFGEQENIFGYKDLAIQLYYSASKLTTYLNIKYTDKVSPEKFDGLKPDDVVGSLSKELPPGYYTNIDDFSAALAKDVNFKPYGELLHSYTVNKDGEDRQFEIYKTDIECPGFREYHERLQTFILFYIDAASFIDVDDERWTFYLLFEKYKKDGNPMYAIAGYMTVYKYYAYPCRTRPRISQVLVLPPFQKQGHGAQLLQTFYNGCYGDSDILDITVEDPSENFQRLRDFVDARNCMNLKSFQPAKLHEGFDDDMSHEARLKLKLNSKQARRIYEILRLKATSEADKEKFRQYRLDIKRRLNIPFQKNGRDFEKLKKALKPDELSATLSCMSMEQRHQYLEKAFEEQIEVYRHVIERLNMA